MRTLGVVPYTSLNLSSRMEENCLNGSLGLDMGSTWEFLKNQDAKKEAEYSVLDGLVASINKLTAQADRGRGGGGGGGPTICWICQEEGHVRSDRKGSCLRWRRYA
jgi:hypothetical protein